MSAVFGRGRWELRLPDCPSLKEKRRVVHSLRDRVRARLKVSAAETDFQEERRRTEISIAFVASDPTIARSLLDQADAIISSDPRIYVMQAESELL
jgi:uncharacterized protein YlxP (DUF503 family)